MAVTFTSTQTGASADYLKYVYPGSVGSGIKKTDSKDTLSDTDKRDIVAFLRTL